MGESDDDLKTLHLARWDTRFWAWLIDFILISLVLNIFFNPFHVINGLFSMDYFGLLYRSLGFLVYWTAMEGVYGQSIGKMVLNIKVTDRRGRPIRFAAALVESFGKSFIFPFPLLPIDCLIGWFGMPGKKIRLFNRISETIVVKTDYREPEGIRYVRERE
ncbi:MAG: RDD family protein [Methanomicrobiales archaeon]|nr:RDD family protein [Methanomicrobiales archaeon]